MQQMEARETEIRADIARLEELRAEADAIAKEKEVLSEALTKLAGNSKSQPRAKAAAE